MTNAEKFKTAAERAQAFDEFCSGSVCAECELAERDKNLATNCCLAFWLELDKDAIEPCPFCGGETHINLGHLKEGVVHHWVDCISPECMYRSAHYTDRSSAISMHNKISRAVKAAKEERRAK